MAVVAPTTDAVPLEKAVSSYFLDETEAGRRPALFAHLMSHPEISTRGVIAVMGFLVVMQLVLVFMTIGLGHWGNATAFAFGCMLVNWSWLAAIWREVRGARLTHPCCCAHAASSRVIRAPAAAPTPALAPASSIFTSFVASAGGPLRGWRGRGRLRGAVQQRRLAEPKQSGRPGPSGRS